ncbi:MAG TPA: ABC transporter permease [Acidimicrobiia bacterium]|nr:ABC transporter permease [Acidimicrobiia bacterium]
MGFWLRRLGRLVVVLICVSFFSYLLLDLLPGDPVTTIAAFAPASVRDKLKHDAHLDEPVYEQYWHWLSNFSHGNLGNYYRSSGVDKVAPDVSSSLPVSLQLMLYSLILTVLIAIPLGVFSAFWEGTWFDRLVNATAFGAIAFPDFALGLVLAYVVGVKLRWLPPGQYAHPSQGLVKHFRSMALPAISLATGQIAGYMRLLRTDMIATLQEDFITMAKAKGMPSRHILWRHALRPSSLTVLTVAGLNVGALIGGAVVIEVVFQLPGMGLLLASNIRAQQFIAVQSIVAILAIGYVVVNTLIDLLYMKLDPRVRSMAALR